MLPHACDEAPAAQRIDILGQALPSCLTPRRAYCKRRELQLEAVRLAPLQARLGVRQRAHNAGRHGLRSDGQVLAIPVLSTVPLSLHPGHGQQMSAT